MKRSRYVLISTLLQIALASSGCQGNRPSDQDQDDVTSTRQAIINGDEVTTDTVGTPFFLNTGLSNEEDIEECSSTLLRDRWLLTAYHCVSMSGTRLAPMADAAELSGTVGNTQAFGIERYAPGAPNIPTDFDVALVKLGSSLSAPPGHAEPWETPLFAGSSSSLVGNTFHCQGWGRVECPSGPLGVLRSADLMVSNLEPDGSLRFVANAIGQVQASGDSGGSCYQFSNGRNVVIGVNSIGSCEAGFSIHTSAEAVRDWVDTIIDRVAVINGETGTLRIKEGGLDHDWVADYPNVTAAAIAGPRIAALGSDGHCRAKDGDFSHAWVDLWTPGGVTQCLLAGSRIGIRTSDGVFRVKEGSLTASFVTQATNVTRGVLSGNRVGAVINGSFFAKEGGLSGSLSFQHSGVTQGYLSGDRMGVLTNTGTLRVKEGSLSAPFFTLRTNVTQAALSGNRIGALSSGHFFVKEGGLFAPWVDVESNVAQGVLSGKRTGVVVNENAGGFPAFRYRVKEGALTAPWVVQEAGSSIPHVAVPLIKTVLDTGGGGGTNPCAGLCGDPTQITISGSYNNTQLGTGAVCIETTSPVNGGNCGNFVSPRTLQVNGTTMPCNGLNWPSVPAQRNGGYCVQTTPGDHAWAFLTLW